MIRFFFAASLLALAPAAVAQGMSMRSAGRPAPSDQAYASAMNKMMDGMHAQPTGDPDRDFARMMTPHHQGAIDMAQVELKYGKDPQMLALARSIVADQEREIGEMRDWLKTHPR